MIAGLLQGRFNVVKFSVLLAELSEEALDVFEKPLRVTEVY